MINPHGPLNILHRDGALRFPQDKATRSFTPPSPVGLRKSIQISKPCSPWHHGERPCRCLCITLLPSLFSDVPCKVGPSKSFFSKNYLVDSFNLLMFKKKYLSIWIISPKGENKKCLNPQPIHKKRMFHFYDSKKEGYSHHSMITKNSRSWRVNLFTKKLHVAYTLLQDKSCIPAKIMDDLCMHIHGHI